MSEIPPTSEADVLAFLQGREAVRTPRELGVPEPLPQVEPVSSNITLPPEAEEFVKSKEVVRSATTPVAAGAEPPVAPEDIEAADTAVNDIARPDAPSVEQTIAFAKTDPVLKAEVTVTDEEKSLYLKAALNDVPIVWNIGVGDGSLRVRLRSITQYEVEVVFRAVRMDIADEDIILPEQQYTRMQWYSCCVQALEVQGKSFDHLSFTHDPASEKLDEDAQTLRTHWRSIHRNLSTARWNQMLMALRVFSFKEKLCNDALANKDFWEPNGGE